MPGSEDEADQTYGEDEFTEVEEDVDEELDGTTTGYNSEAAGDGEDADEDDAAKSAVGEPEARAEASGASPESGKEPSTGAEADTEPVQAALAEPLHEASLPAGDASSSVAAPTADGAPSGALEESREKKPSSPFSAMRRQPRARCNTMATSELTQELADGGDLMGDWDKDHALKEEQPVEAVLKQFPSGDEPPPDLEAGAGGEEPRPIAARTLNEALDDRLGQDMHMRPSLAEAEVPSQPYIGPCPSAVRAEDEATSEPYRGPQPTVAEDEDIYTGEQDEEGEGFVEEELEDSMAATTDAPEAAAADAGPLPSDPADDAARMAVVQLELMQKLPDTEEMQESQMPGAFPESRLNSAIVEGDMLVPEEGLLRATFAGQLSGLPPGGTPGSVQMPSLPISAGGTPSESSPTRPATTEAAAPGKALEDLGQEGIVHLANVSSDELLEETIERMPKTKESAANMPVYLNDLKKQFSKSKTVEELDAEDAASIAWSEQHEYGADGENSDAESKCSKGSKASKASGTPKKEKKLVKASSYKVALLTKMDKAAAAEIIQGFRRKKADKFKLMATNAAARASTRLTLRLSVPEDLDLSSPRTAPAMSARALSQLQGQAAEAPTSPAMTVFPEDPEDGVSPEFVNTIWDWAENGSKFDGCVMLLPDGRLRWNYQNPQLESRWHVFEGNRIVMWFARPMHGGDKAVSVRRVMRVTGAAGEEVAVVEGPDAEGPDAEDPEAEVQEGARMERRATTIPAAPSNWEEMKSPSQRYLDHARSRYEGDTPAKKQKASPQLSEAQLFLELLRTKGGGSVTIAWRRYFDVDGDGEMSFQEFARALANVGYGGDSLNLWQYFAADSKEGSLKLHQLDPVGAKYLDAFSHWCDKEHGGPIELFKKLDDDGSDSLTPDEISQGLQEFGFFVHDDTPKQLSSEKGFLKHLYPLLDATDAGCITADQLLFLVEDKELRENIKAELDRQKEFGTDETRQPLPKSLATTFLSEYTRKYTQCGGRHWKMIREHQQVAQKDMPAAKAKQAQQLAMQKNSTPKYLRKHRMLKREWAEEDAKKAEEAQKAAEEEATRAAEEAAKAPVRCESAPDLGSRKSSSAGSRRPSRNDSAPSLKANRNASLQRLTKPMGPSSKAPKLPKLPGAAPSTQPAEAAAKAAQAQAQKNKKTRSIYCQGVTPPMPPVSWYVRENAAHWYNRNYSDKVSDANQSRQPPAFNPTKASDFISQDKSHMLFAKYSGF